MPTTYFVAWWNVENLFDYENSPRRTEKLRRAIGSDLDGWTPDLRDRKIDQLASVIARMNNGLGPDILGVCEVENAWVLQRLANRASALLANRNYEILHADTSDKRGIDVAFILDAGVLTAPVDERFQHVVMRRTATREIFQVNFETNQGRTWSILLNHWPSRSGGTAESAGYRMIAGETLGYFHQRILEVHGTDTPVLAMGDFNDEPFDLSLVRHALSTRQRTKVVNGTSPRLWNLMWPTTGVQAGTFYFHNEPNVLDQILVNKNMAKQNSPIRVKPETMQVITFPDMVNDGDYPKPIPFGGLGKPVNQDGFSDHFPIAIEVEEAD